MDLKIKLINGGKLPTKHLNSAGLDLYLNEDIEIKPNSKVTASTGVCVQLPTDFFAQVVGRSGLSSKTSVNCITGTIDNDYRGEIKIILENTSNKIVKFNRYDKIAQLVLHYQPKYKIVLVSNLNETERGANGFGSSGK